MTFCHYTLDILLNYFGKFKVLSWFPVVVGAQLLQVASTPGMQDAPVSTGPCIYQPAGKIPTKHTLWIP